MIPDAQPQLPIAHDVVIRRLRTADVPGAAQVFRRALAESREAVKEGRWADGASLLTAWMQREPLGAFVAEVAGEILGLALALHWGSVGFLGPLSVHPSHENRGIGSRLLERCREAFANWGCTHVELFTYPDSARHVAFYEKGGFTPRGLSRWISWDVSATAAPLSTAARLSTLPAGRRALALGQVRQLMEQIHPGLSLDREIRGRTPPDAEILLLHGTSHLKAMAICDLPDPLAPAVALRDAPTCQIVFAAVRPGADAKACFEALLWICGSYAAAHGCTRLAATVPATRHELWQRLQAMPCHIEAESLCMARGTEHDFSRPSLLVLHGGP